MKNWSIILPYYNEARYLPGTLESLCLQNYKNFILILVNNASTDTSEAVARNTLSHYPDVKVIFLDEKTPGKTSALARGLHAVNTSFVATCDADTYYPPNYLTICNQILEKHQHYTAVMACDIYQAYYTRKSRRRCWKIFIKSKIFNKQCHAGGYAQAFRVNHLRQVKGFSTEIWPYVLMDHEIVHRLLPLGKVYYSPYHWCMPSPRRTDRSDVQWNRLEKILYQYTPYFLKSWFFYSFLSKRMEKRKAKITRLREHSWDQKTENKTKK